MRFDRFRLPAGLTGLLLCLAAHAGPLPGGAELSMSVPQLQEAVAGLQHVARPARLAGGLLGSWTGPSLRIGGVPVTPTFFVAGGQVARVEYIASDGTSAADFDALVAWGRSAWGRELASQSPEGDYASWSRDDLEAYVQRTSAARGPQMRLVIKRIVAKDATTL